MTHDAKTPVDTATVAQHVSYAREWWGQDAAKGCRIAAARALAKAAQWQAAADVIEHDTAHTHERM